MPKGPTPEQTAEQQALVRATPPAATLRWLVDSVAPGGAIGPIEPMPGGSTAAMHRVTLTDARGHARDVVLRRYVLRPILDETPDIVHHESVAIGLVAPLAVPTPELLAYDTDGTHADAPAIVLSWLDGRPVWEALRDRQLEAMAEALVELHAVPLDGVDTLRPIERYGQSTYEPPRWSTAPVAWERAFEIFHGPIPTGDTALVHRDFHPGNLLWRRGDLTGVVDWQSACLGPSAVDVGHCRLNMFFYDESQAHRLRHAWERASGRTYDPWGDVMSIVGALDLVRTGRAMTRSRAAIEHAIVSAVAELGG